MKIEDYSLYAKFPDNKIIKFPEAVSFKVLQTNKFISIYLRECKLFSLIANSRHENHVYFDFYDLVLPPGYYFSLDIVKNGDFSNFWEVIRDEFPFIMSDYEEILSPLKAKYEALQSTKDLFERFLDHEYL